MQTLEYKPDDDIEIHEEGAIRLICASFQTHEAGLPEWIKNSADAYVREDISPDQRVVLVILSNGRGASPASISVLDFVGMTSEDIEESFRQWADPNAATRGGAKVDVQGGHGNGGKCYMTQMFDDFAFVTTVRSGKGSKYGVAGGSIRFGYIPDRERGRSYAVEHPSIELEKALNGVGCSLGELPKSARSALEATRGFSLVTGLGPKGLGKTLQSQRILQDLEEHPQMIRSLELCSVFLLSNGKIQNNGVALSLPSIPAMDGYEVPREIPVPKSLKDPRTDETVSTVGKGELPEGKLILRTSNVSMRYSRKGRHNIVYRANSGYVGSVEVTQLDVQSPFRDRIYGECNLQSLEACKMNDRRALAVTPLSRAVQAFVSREVEKFAKEFEARDRRRYNQEEKTEISRMNEALDRWKNRFLKEYMRGLWGPETGENPDPRPSLPSGVPARIEVSLSHRRSGLGVSFRPNLRFWDGSGQEIRPVPFRWISSDTNVALVDNDLGILSTFAYGETAISAETLNGKLKSNSVSLEVVQIRNVHIHPPEVSLPAGSRHRLEAVCTLADEGTTSDLYLVWTEGDSSVARVSAAGLVYGFNQGVTEVVAGDDHCVAKSPSRITVLPGDGKGRGGKKGKGFPQVLVSSVDKDPETKEDVNFSSEDPPIWQRPQDADRNIWWINSSSPLAKLFLSKDKGYGFDSREWRVYHLERYVDVIVQIAIASSPRDNAAMSANDWLLEWGSQVASVQTAVAVDLVDFIQSGVLPED